MQRFLSGFLGLAVIGFLAGCTGLGGGNVSPEKFTQSRPTVVSERILVSGDILEFSVEVAGKPEISQKRVQLGHDGLITVPLAGDLRVAGCTSTQVRQILQEAYRGFYVTAPLVMLSLQSEHGEGAWGAVTVLGQVKSPGSVPLVASSIRLSEVVQKAGGFSGSACQDAVKISRAMSDGKRIQCVVDFQKIGREGLSDSDLELFAGDVVYVPERIF